LATPTLPAVPFQQRLKDTHNSSYVNSKRFRSKEVQKQGGLEAQRFRSKEVQKHRGSEAKWFRSKEVQKFRRICGWLFDRCQFKSGTLGSGLVLHQVFRSFYIDYFM
jgi:hypothetical protein